MRTCWRCDGLGTLGVKEDRRPCQTCGGLGKLPYPPETDEFDEAAADEKRDFNGD